MNPSFKYFMGGVIDYAGLFPPAGLDLKTAVRNYENYRKGNSRELLGAFIIPAGRLQQLIAPADIRLSVILSDRMAREERNGLKMFSPQIKAVETRLPERLSGFEEFSAHLGEMSIVMKDSGVGKAALFVEASAPHLCDEVVPDLNKMDTGPENRLGFKLRCGGLTPESFPKPNEIAAVIGACVKYDLPLKFTAGLHHPVRHFARELGTMQYGFINVVGAALLAFGIGLSDREIVSCLMEENADRFAFNESGFSWNGKSMDADEIRRLRRERVMGFGSCSFEEPVADLQTLGHL